jgi:VWFA-related protein
MTHWKVALAVVLSVLISVLICAPATAQQKREPRTQEIYVSVVDSSGKPVVGLTAADFVVREDGVAREVLKAGPATEPLTISLLIDDSQASNPAINDIRNGLNGFIERMSDKAEMALATFGERPTSLVDYTMSAEALKKGVTRIFARPGSGAYLMDAIVEVSKGLQKRETKKRPTIIVLMMEDGPEFSNRHYEPVLEEVKKSGAALHVLAVGSPSASQEDEIRNRNMVIAEGTKRTGGRRDQLLAISAIPERFKQVADELTSQYVVSYARPESLIPPERLEVTVTGPGLTVRSRTRAAEQ